MRVPRIAIAFLRTSRNTDLVRQSCALLANCTTKLEYAKIIASGGVIDPLMQLIRRRPYPPYVRARARACVRACVRVCVCV